MSQKAKLPRHHNPSQRVTANAPYNFIPLPEIVIPAVNSPDELPRHDTWGTGKYCHTGHFVVALTTKTPTYIRGLLTKKEFDNQECEYDLKSKKINNSTPFYDLPKNKPDFYHPTGLLDAAIPGSSLRGMIRSLFEIVTYSKMKWVTDKKLFFRTVDNSSIGLHYRDRMGEDQVETGFLTRRGNKYEIQVCQMARVHHSKLQGRPFRKFRKTDVPKWRGTPQQNQPVWVTLTSSGKFVDELEYAKQTGPEWREGRLVISGNMPGRTPDEGKQKEFVFLLPDPNAKIIEIPGEMLERFHEDDQITQWQQWAFPANEPRPNARHRNGLLISAPKKFEESLFFLREKNEQGELELTFFGRARMFRLPYKNSPLDLVPSELCDLTQIDFAEAVFGYVRTKKEIDAMKKKGVSIAKQGDPQRAYAGRVSVKDATLTKKLAESDLYEEEFEPQILATPKPTAFQHYLTQDTDCKDELHHYGIPLKDENGNYKATIRGHKLYWSRGERTAADLRETDRKWVDRNTGRVKANSTQHTRIRPVKAGVTFEFKVYFENLSDAELGALWWTLAPLGKKGSTYCHRMGMGKPLGMGVVELNKIALHLDDRMSQYETLFEKNSWQAGESEVHDYRQTFEKFVLDHVPGWSRSLAQLHRIKILLAMLEWQQTGDFDKKTYMPLEKRKGFAARWILPDPLNWRGESRAPMKCRETDSQPRKKASRQQPDTTKKSARRRQLDESLPEVREEVSDFATRFARMLQEKADDES